jgi:glutaminyl-peptide cyclotransferase
VTKRSTAIYLSAILLVFTSVIAWYGASLMQERAGAIAFDGERALGDVSTMVSFGPRIPGSLGHSQTQTWIQAELESAGWTVGVQTVQEASHTVENIIARRDTRQPEILLGAHYDTRIFADRDPDPLRRNLPVPGANDGASGAAVLIELARILPHDTPPIWLVFFDAEDNGNIEDWEWALGSRAFVARNTTTPRAVIIVDMVGDADLNLYFERNSDTDLSSELWQTATELGYREMFIPQPKHDLIDDHIPFIEAGLPAVDIIDFDYPYWHTTSDTLDKVSAQSLQAVGTTLYSWILQQDYQQ